MNSLNLLIGLLNNTIMTVTPSPTPISTMPVPSTQATPSVSQIVSIIKDGFNILFFITTGAVSVITYLKARKTILQPIKTEVFKQQLLVFSEIMEIFNGKSEVEIRKFFGFDKMLKANTVLLLDNYASLFFEIKIDENKRPYSLENCPSGMISKEYAEKYLSLADEATYEETAVTSSTRPDPSTKAAIWNKYEFPMIRISKEFMEAQNKINKILKSPLLPKECATRDLTPI